MHHLIVDRFEPDQAEMAIQGEQARHAVRVRRMEPGERLILMDGAGTKAAATVAASDKNGPNSSWRLLVKIDSVDYQPRPEPAVHVICPAPKGDLLETMIDQLSQVGAASWRPLDTERSEREPRRGKIDRLIRITHESAKQCGRPWFMDINEGISFDNAIQLSNAVIADAGGSAVEEVARDMQADTGTGGIHVLVGPEGGFSAAERSLAHGAGLALIDLGPHVLRIGTAAVVGASSFVRVVTRR
ncbi:MAG: RsmE family RNA methyltransferase [Phycisphaerales bacterium JB060]